MEGGNCDRQKIVKALDNQHNEHILSYNYTFFNLLKLDFSKNVFNVSNMLIQHAIYFECK